MSYLIPKLLEANKEFQNITDTQAYGLLCLAAFKNDLDTVRLLLSGRFNLSFYLPQETDEIRTPLYWAAINKNIEMIQLLKEHNSVIEIAVNQVILEKNLDAFNLLIDNKDIPSDLFETTSKKTGKDLLYCVIYYLTEIVYF